MEANQEGFFFLISRFDQLNGVCIQLSGKEEKLRGKLIYSHIPMKLKSLSLICVPFFFFFFLVFGGGIMEDTVITDHFRDMTWH